MVKSANLTEEQLARIFELSPVTSIPILMRKCHEISVC